MPARTEIGAYTSFSGPVRAAGQGALTVGSWGAIGEEFVAITHNHDIRYANMHVPLQRALGLQDGFATADVNIGDAVWIGQRVTVLPGARIGSGSVIGAGSVVTGEIPPFTIAVGVPCRVNRRRFPEAVIEALLEILWWEWTIEEMQQRRLFFQLDLTTCSVAEIMSAAAHR